MNAEARTICRESTVAESTVQTPRWVLATGLSRLTAYIRGKEILILGPGSAGKTKFTQYLQSATLDPEGKREMTYGVTRSPAFAVSLGREEGPVLRVRRTVDTPGQVGPLQHALLVARHRPHAVIVLLDCSSDPLATLRWFCLFCTTLDSVLRKTSSVARRLQEMVVILNKRDKIEDREFAKLHQAVREALERFLSVVWGAARVRSIPILESISVRTGRGTALIDACVAQLTERLAGREDRQDAAAGPRLVAVPPAGSHPYAPRPSSHPAPTLSSGLEPPAAAPAAKLREKARCVGIRPVSRPHDIKARAGSTPVAPDSGGRSAHRPPPGSSGRGASQGAGRHGTP